jgi:hypothetical protein
LKELRRAFILSAKSPDFSLEIRIAGYDFASRMNLPTLARGDSIL